MRTAVIDNYDSFTYNLVHIVKETGTEVCVFRNDQFQLKDLEPFDNIILSPGPGIPSEAGLLLDVIRQYKNSKPMLGVCLGHQAIGEVYGAKLQNLSEVYHGVATPINIIADDPIFSDLPRRFDAGRYHSWAISSESLPDCLEVTAKSDDECIMAIRHRSLPIHGIQFHPESVLTPLGKTIIQNFMQIKA